MRSVDVCHIFAKSHSYILTHQIIVYILYMNYFSILNHSNTLIIFWFSLWIVQFYNSTFMLLLFCPSHAIAASPCRRIFELITQPHFLRIPDNYDIHIVRISGRFFCSGLLWRRNTSILCGNKNLLNLVNLMKRLNLALTLGTDYVQVIYLPNWIDNAPRSYYHEKNHMSGIGAETSTSGLRSLASWEGNV